MPGKKPQIDWKKIFIGIILLLGGVIFVFVPVADLHAKILVYIVLGITMIMLGTSFIWEATEDIRKKQSKSQETKDTNKPGTAT